MKTKLRQRVNVKQIARTKHIHNFSRTVRVQGSRQRFGCDSCPAIDADWYRVPDLRRITVSIQKVQNTIADLSANNTAANEAVQTMTGWMSGTSGVKEPDFSEDKLTQMDKKQLMTIAVTFDVKHNTKTTKPELIAGIMAAVKQKKEAA